MALRAYNTLGGSHLANNELPKYFSRNCDLLKKVKTVLRESRATGKGATIREIRIVALKPQLLFAPLLHGEEDGHEALALGSEGVFHAWRHLAEVGTRKKAVVDELSELFGKRGLGYVPNAVSDPPGQREQILAALDAVISDFGEERLRRYRVNLRHLWEVREKVPTWVICEKGAEDAS